MKQRIIFLLIFVLAGGICFAAEAEGAGAHHFDWLGLIARIINSAILFGALYYLLRKPIQAYLDQKSKDIKLDIETREEHVNQTQARLTEISNRLAHIELEIVTIKHEAEEQGNAEKARLLEAAQAESQRLLTLANSEADNRIRIAVQQFKGAVADDIINRFKQEITASIDDKAHLRIIDDNIDHSGEVDERK